MTGIVMFRANNGVLFYTDGGVYRSKNDFTMTGQSGKVSVFPHLSMAVASMGYTRLRFLIEFNCALDWTSYDHMLTVIKQNAEDALWTLNGLEDFQTKPITTILLMGGYSDANQMWQTHSLLIDNDEVGELKEEVQLWFMPMPDEAAWRSHGFDMQTLNISDFCADPEMSLPKILSAMRETPVAMTDDIAMLDDPDCPKGHSVGGFIERVFIGDGAAHRQIIHRWPDKVGEMIVL